MTPDELRAAIGECLTPAVCADLSVLDRPAGQEAGAPAATSVRALQRAAECVAAACHAEPAPLPGHRLVPLNAALLAAARIAEQAGQAGR